MVTFKVLHWPPATLTSHWDTEEYPKTWIASRQDFVSAARAKCHREVPLQTHTHTHKPVSAVSCGYCNQNYIKVAFVKCLISPEWMDERGRAERAPEIFQRSQNAMCDKPLYISRGHGDWWLHQRGNQQPRGLGENRAGAYLIGGHLTDGVPGL